MGEDETPERRTVLAAEFQVPRQGNRRSNQLGFMPNELQRLNFAIGLRVRV